MPGAGSGDVEAFPAHLRGDQGVRRVHGGALGAVRSGRVQQLNVAGHVVRGQRDAAVVDEVLDAQRPVAVAFDAPATRRRS